MIHDHVENEAPQTPARAPTGTIVFALVIGIILVSSAFSLVGFRITQIRDRIIFPFLAQKTLAYAPETLQTIRNAQGLAISALVYTNPEASKTAALFFPNELLDLNTFNSRIGELRAVYGLVIVPAYRGSVGSAEKGPSEKLLYRDAHIAQTYAQEEGFTLKFLGGQRLGAAVAAYLASKTPVAKLELYDPWIKTSEVFAKAPLLPLLKLFSWDDFDVSELLASTVAESITIFVAEDKLPTAKALQAATKPGVSVDIQTR